MQWRYWEWRVFTSTPDLIPIDSLAGRGSANLLVPGRSPRFTPENYGLIA